MVSLDGSGPEYVANVTASGQAVFEDGNNWETVTIDVRGTAPGTPLVVDAGSPQEVDEGETVTLAGTATGAPPGSLTYQWSQTSPEDPPVLPGDSAARTVTFDAPQVDKAVTFAFTLTATDGTNSASDLVTVTVRDTTIGPAGFAVHAESSHVAYEGDSVTLSGIIAGASPGTLTYQWVQTSPTSPQVLGDSAARAVTFAAPQVDKAVTFAFTLTATDGTNSASDLVTVTVRDTTVRDTTIGPAGFAVHAESSHVAYEGDSVTLSGIIAGASPGTLTYQWVQTSPTSPQVLGDSAARAVTFAAPDVDGTVAFAFTLTARDGPTSASDQVTVTVRDRPATTPATPPVTPPVAVTVPDFRDSAPSAAGSKGRLLVLPPAMTIDSAGYPESSVPESIRGALQDAGAPVAPIPSDGTFDFPLEINGNGYALRHPSITLVPQNLTAGQPASIAVTLYDRYDIAYFAAHLDLPGSRAPHEDDAYVEYDGGTVQASDPGGIMSGESISIIQDPHNPSKKTVVLSATFSGPAGTADMVIRTENEHGGTLTVRVIDAPRGSGRRFPPGRIQRGSGTWRKPRAAGRQQPAGSTHVVRV
jgi:hypothetical protein